MELTTNQKGALAEAAVIKAAVEAHVGVLLPLSVERYDLVLDLRPRLLRVQCKWAVREGTVVVIRCATSRRTRRGSPSYDVWPYGDRRDRGVLPRAESVLPLADRPLP